MPIANRNYTIPSVSCEWSNSRETHPAVAVAIHALADGKRSAEDIWEAPTAAEWDHVTMAIHQYVSHGDFPAEHDGRYSWGAEAVELEV